MHDNRLGVGVRGVACVLPGIGISGPLDEQVAERDVALLGDDAHAAAGRVVVDLLEKSRSFKYCKKTTDLSLNLAYPRTEQNGTRNGLLSGT